MTIELKQAEETAAHSLSVIQQELSALDGWTVDNDEDNTFAAEMLQDVKSRCKALEAKRKEITSPLNKALKAVNNLFRPPRDAFESAEKLLKGKIASYLALQEARNQAALAAAGSAETVEDASAALASIEHADAPKGVSVRHVWRAVVIDADAVPAAFLSPDMNKIAEWIRKCEGEPIAIPGVRFDREAIVSSRATLPGKISHIEIK